MVKPSGTPELALPRDSEDEEEKQNKANLVSPSVRAWHSLDLR